MLPGAKRVQVDAAEDRRQRDQHDRAVQGRHEDGRRSCSTAPPTCSGLSAVCPAGAQMALREPVDQGSGGLELASSASVNPLDKATASCSALADRRSSSTGARLVGDGQHDPPAVVRVVLTLDQPTAPRGRRESPPSTEG